MTPQKYDLTDAFVLLVGPAVLSRHPGILYELHDRGLAILLVSPLTQNAARLRARVQDERHPFSLISDFALVSGSLEAVGSYVDEAVAAVRSWVSSYRIRGLCAVGEDLVEPAGLLADMLDLPSPGLRSTRVSRNKLLQRCYLGDWSPRAVLITPTERDAFAERYTSYPAVMKPTGRDSSSGVQVVTSREELLQAFSSMGAAEMVLLEEKASGSECSVESLVQRGEIRFASITDKRTSEDNSHFFVELGHTVPHPDINAVDQARVLDVNRAILDRLCFEDGVAHVELRVSKNRVILMEIAARLPGDGITALYRLATGHSLESAALRIALGEDVSYPAPARFARQVYLTDDAVGLHGGAIDGVTPTWLDETDLWPQPSPVEMDRPAQLQAVIVSKHSSGDPTGVRESGDRVASFLIDAPSAADLESMEVQVADALSAAGFSREAVGTLDKVDRRGWNSLVGGRSFYLTHEWLRSLENDPRAAVQYALLRRGEELVAASPIYLIQEELNKFYRPDLLIDGRWTGRYQLAGTRRAYVNELFISEQLGPSGRRDAAEQLLDLLTDHAALHNVDSTLFLFISTASATQLLEARGDLQPLLTSVDTSLHVQEETIDAYLARFASRRRRQLRNEMATFAEAGYEHATERLSACWHEAGPLLANIQHRYGHPGTRSSGPTS